MKILVCGGRDYQNFEHVERVLEEYNEGSTKRHPIITHLIHGDANGVDRMAGRWARDRGVQEVVCPANWTVYGKRAGYLRNLAMSQMDVDLVIAFPGGKGTAMMVKIAQQNGTDVAEIEPT